MLFVSLLRCCVGRRPLAPGSKVKGVRRLFLKVVMCLPTVHSRCMQIGVLCGQFAVLRSSTRVLNSLVGSASNLACDPLSINVTSLRQ